MSDLTLMFDCPHCKTQSKIPIRELSEAEIQQGDPEPFEFHGVCLNCHNGVVVIASLMIHGLSEHELKKNGEVYRMAESLRWKGHL